jgi:ABC-type branched-subunit amino acid transport system substrate-binding protein
MKRVFLAPMLVALGLSAACTLVYDDGVTQCRSQEDCLARGEAFANTTCSLDRVCVKIEIAEQACANNKECVDRNGGAPYICRKTDKKCISLVTPECPRVLGEREDYLNDEAIILGHMAQSNPDGQLSELAVELARSEIRRNLGGGLPPRTEGGPKRPLVVVSCNAEPTGTGGLGSAAENFRAKDHLVNTLQIPAMVGPFTSGQALAIYNETIPAGVFAMTQNSVGATSFLPDNDLVFRVGFSENLTIQVANPFINGYLKEQIVTQGLAAAGDPMRVALLTSKEQPSGDALAKILKFNDQDAASQLGGNFLLVDLGDVTDRINDPTPEAKRVKAFAQIIAFKPHVIIWATTPVYAPLGLLPLMRQWPAGLPRPFQMSTLASWQAFMVTTLQTLNIDVVRQRYFGMHSLSPQFSDLDWSSFQSAMRLKYPELQNQLISVPTGQHYDAFYMITYAISAIPTDQPVTGANIAKAMRRVADASGGVEVKWGPDALNQGIGFLKQGNSITYVGATGPYRFDPNGDNAGNPEIFCVTKGLDNRPNGIKRSGYIYNTGTQMASGTVDCP